MADFPSASTTGVRSGVTLTPSGGITINTAGAVVSGLNITGDVVITAPNVTLVDCRVTGEIVVQSTGATIEYVDAVGRNSVNVININPNGRLGEGDNTIVRFCDISGAENGIWLEGDGCRIEDNYIHNLFSNTGASDPHIDGIQIPAAYPGTTRTTDAIIQHNNLDLNNQTASSSITMRDATNIDILDNRLSGGAAILRIEGSSQGCDVIGNTFDEYVFIRLDDQTQGAAHGVYSGNIDEATGALLPFNDAGGAIAGSVSINNVTVSEGASGTKVATFTVTRSGGTAAFDVNYATSNGTATVADGDYAAASNTLHFATNQNTQTISVAINGDTRVEGNETFNVGLSSATNGATISDGQGIGTITNDDSAAPTIASFSNDSGVVGDHITNDPTPTLVGTAAASSTVKVFDGSTQVGTATANSSGAWTLTTTALANGSHSLTANATNSGGTSSALTPLSVTIDTVAPSAPTIVASITAATLASTGGEVLTGAAEANSMVTVFDGTTKLGTVAANSSGAWSYTAAGLSVGSHTVTATATDVAGNTGGASPAVVVTIGASPEAYVDFTDLSQTSSGANRMQGTAHAGGVIKLYDGTASIGSATAGTDGSWTFTKSGLSNTVHTITAQEVNSLGQVVATSTGAAILGSTRSDSLTGTAGKDVFLGNGGQDTFVFAANFGSDAIKDFDAIGRIHDVVQFSKSVFDSFASVLDHASQVGRDVVITAGTDTLTLKNTKVNALDSHDFHFA